MKMQDKTLPWSHATSAVFALRWPSANSARWKAARGMTGAKLAGITGSRATTESGGGEREIAAEGKIE